MRVGILTWYKANNHGAVLQAYASQQTLNMLGVENEILEYTRRTRLQKNSYLSRIVKLLSPYVFVRKKIKAFDSVKRTVMDDFIRDKIRTGEDCYNVHNMNIMVGSDMVFCLKQGFNPYMFGIGMDKARIFSYAASAGGSTYNEFVQMGLDKDVSAALNQFTALGCRDEGTMQTMDNLTSNVQICENIDPVLLYGFEREKEDWDTGKWKNHKKYVLLYSYHQNMNDKTTVRQIQAYAKEHNCSVVSVGFYHSWCDECVNASPQEFLEMFVNAEHIFTDTFHGTVFALITGKNFTSLIQGNGFKLRDLLTKCNMTDRIAEPESVLVVADRTTDYSKYNKWIASEREKSLEFLKSQVL